MKLSLRNRFLIPMIVLVALGMGTSTAVSYYKSKSALVAANNKQITQLAESTIGIVGTWIADRKLEINNWSDQKLFQSALSDTFVGKAARKDAIKQLGNYKENYIYYENLYLLNPGGDILASSAEMNELTDSNINEKVIQEVVSDAGKDGIYVSEIFVSTTSGNPIFAIVSPITKNGVVTGLLYGVLDIEIFNMRYIAPITVGETGYAYAFNQDGIVIAHPEKSKIMTMNMKEYDFGRDMLNTSQGLLEYTFNGEGKIAALATSPELGWTIAISAFTDEILASVRSVGIMNLTVTSTIIVLAVICILLVASSTVRPINRSISGLEQAVEQVVTGATEVASSSQTLSSGASQQAATIEETSSSLEEMSSMTRQNADNASAAKAKMDEAFQIVAKVNQHMVDMEVSIKEITQSSEETGKIVKTIDEIAFQTNLLALNAAVEAARAGEAGAGFAVVADEVRNLAMKAAEAAKTTTDLIETTVKAVKKGNELTQSTREAFLENIDISEKVGELVEEIAAASSEQAQGIDEINRAVAEMDKVVQQVAATAEESAAASEEMNSQAMEMEGFVRGLTSIVSGSRRESPLVASLQPEDSTAGRHQPASSGEPTRMRMQSRDRSEQPEQPHRASSLEWAEEVNPTQVIPMQDKDFKDF